MTATIRELSDRERSPGGFAASCCILHCPKHAEYVGTRHADFALYCEEHAAAFARVNRIEGQGWHRMPKTTDSPKS